MILGSGALALKDVTAAAIPLLLGEGVDSLMHKNFEPKVVLWFCAALVAFAAVKGLFQYWMRVILIGVSRDIEYDLRNDLFAHLTTLSQDFCQRSRTGDIMARATNDLNAVRMMLGPGLMYWMETSLMFVVVLIVMLRIDWPLTLCALFPAPLVSLAVVYFGRRIHARFDRIQKLFSDLSSRVQESIAGVRIIRAYVREETELKYFATLNLEYTRENIRLARISGFFLPLLQALIGITLLIVLWFGGLRLLNGRLTLGQFVMFNTYLAVLVWPMIAFGWVVNLIERGTASLKRITALMSEKPSIVEPLSPSIPSGKLRGEIEFCNVSVRYPGGYALDGVSFRIVAGSLVAIVGHTGSGKTTLANLIPRLLDPDEGCVLIDGVDVRAISLSTLRRRIGFVPQETFLFSATVAENIAFGVESVTEERIRWAAEVAGLGPDIVSFPDGYQTLVGERGITLSGGQKQRTAIARAILRDPSILILDDALSSVDTLTEDRILSTLAEIMRERTTILISHRVSTVRNADRIFVLEKGKIAEQGTHQELLELGGYYADLYQKQQLEEELEAI
jgi:ATP-binding cassette subfamily B protein